MHRRRGPNFTYVSGCVKYMIFILNFIFWLLGGLLIAVGLYAFIDKWQATGLIKLDTMYDLMLNISLLIALLGGVVFIVSFAGCIGALRENTCLLKFFSLCHPYFLKKFFKYQKSTRQYKQFSLCLPYSLTMLFKYQEIINMRILSVSSTRKNIVRECRITPNFIEYAQSDYSLCLLVLFLVEMGGAVCGFVFPRSLHGLVEQSFTERVVHAYRDDPDLQNFIDYAQSDFQCCGLTADGYMDWSKNEYFNCSSPSVERCGVPFSCCVNATDISSGLVNIMCGYGVQNYPVAEASKRVWTSGCIEIVRSWAERNLYTIASVALGVALSQLFVIYLAKTLEGQIELQKARWQT